MQKDMALRDIFEGVSQFNAQVLDVAPLALLHRLTCQLNVVRCQLSLIKQPLDHKDRACTGKARKSAKQFEPVLIISMCTFTCIKADHKPTFYRWEDSISKEAVPLLSFMGLFAALWYHPSPVPNKETDAEGYISNLMI